MPDDISILIMFECGRGVLVSVFLNRLKFDTKIMGVDLFYDSLSWLMCGMVVIGFGIFLERRT